jgi:catechol 2,3-dioxygenase-like lactoylglutathione lyase family enzyme
LTGGVDKSGMQFGFSLDHVAITVSDLEVSMDFYTTLFGFTRERMIEMPGNAGRIALLRKPGFTIEMFQFAGALTPTVPLNDLRVIGVRHFALGVKDIRDAAAFLKEHGVEFISEPVTGARGFDRCFIKDPDGIPIELTEGPGSV